MTRPQASSRQDRFRVHIGGRAGFLKAIATLAICGVAFAAAAQADAIDDANEGIAAIAQGDNGRAIDILSRVLEAEPGDLSPSDRATVLFNRGLAQQNSGDLAAAIADYSEALRLSPGDTFSHFNRGTAFEDRGDLDCALADFTSAARIDPNRQEFVGRRDALTGRASGAACSVVPQRPEPAVAAAPPLTPPPPTPPSPPDPPAPDPAPAAVAPPAAEPPQVAAAPPPAAPPPPSQPFAGQAPFQQPPFGQGPVAPQQFAPPQFGRRPVAPGPFAAPQFGQSPSGNRFGLWAVNFGDDLSPFAHDGECDDARFYGPGMAKTRLLKADLFHDATDCRTLFEAGHIQLRA
ncbi:MAG: tetratricopeptide repeat protein [Alphaproteobacteria bacterium]|nr:tetratricopeptide repeat protein [Alphaproteobacteria bacterium]